jgi:hypothetical protein
MLDRRPTPAQLGMGHPTYSCVIQRARSRATEDIPVEDICISQGASCLLGSVKLGRTLIRTLLQEGSV